MSFPYAKDASTEVTVDRVEGSERREALEVLAAEEPLEISLGYGERGGRMLRPLSVTMRTPGQDRELAAGFLYTEGVVRDAGDIEAIREGRGDGRNTVCVELASHVEVRLATLERNFYTTSSCGICGKASMLALRSVCPPRRVGTFCMTADTICKLPGRLREAQAVFARTGGLHAAGLFDRDGSLRSMREDVGRHNAVDKVLGEALLADRIPCSDAMLLLSGRASFELLQKAVMGGVSMVAAVGAPSSLAVQVAKEFGITLIGFLREKRFNIYHGGASVL